MTIDRRNFLKGATLLGGAAVLGAGLSGCNVPGPPWSTPPADLPTRFTSMLSLPAAQSPVKNVVVVMMENRSFDHWLGWLANDEPYLEAGLSRYGSGFHLNGAQQQSYQGPSGEVGTEHLVGAPDMPSPFQGCGFGDPGHTWTDGRAQRDGGFLATGSGNDSFALGYYLGDDLPFTSNLARRFTVMDDSHASLLGPTYPNREYLHSAQSGGNKTNALPPSTGFPWTTIWDKLGAAQVPARYYYSDLPFLGLWGSRMSPYLTPITQFYEDCANGTLPAVSFVDPKFLGATEEDDHPLADVRFGQAFLRRVFQAFAEGPQWQSGAFFLTYDEWGGFFDHVAPPTLIDNRSSSVDADNFGQAGFRVPTVMASPFAQPGFVDHRAYDHTSILRFLEWRFLGAPPEGIGTDPNATWYLTYRDLSASNIGAGLSATIVDADLGFDIDNLAIDPPAAACGTAAANDLARDAFGPSTFQESFDSGWFEQARIPVLGQ